MANRPAYSVFKELEHGPDEPHAFLRFVISLFVRHAPGEAKEVASYEADLRIALRDACERKFVFPDDEAAGRFVEGCIAFARRFYPANRRL